VKQDISQGEELPMQPNRFVILTGHLTDYPLSDLVGILRRQRKSGRLTIEYPAGPASIFFSEGELVDAQINDFTGLQAICLAIAQPDSPFNFNPLICSSRRSIESSAQRVVIELLGCWDESPLEIVSTVRSDPISAARSKELPEAKEPLLLSAAKQSPLRGRSLLLVVSAGVLGFTIALVITLIVGLNSVVTFAEASKTSVLADTSHQPKQTVVGTPAASNETTRSADQVRRSETRAALRKTSQQSQPSTQDESRDTSDRKVAESSSNSDEPAVSSIKVVLEVENGRVIKASIGGHKPGMESLEGLALRIARQRRFPAKQNGPQTVKINVTRAN
jgi:hypothetical protein